MKHPFVAMTFLFVVFGPLAALLQAAPPTGPTRTLFDGKSLAGWKVIGGETVVQEGAILLKSGNGVVQTEQRYADFILELDWKALDTKMWDSGIYFRYNEIPKKRPWPMRYQANLRKGMEGNVNGLKGAKSTGLVKLGEWNHFKLTVLGTTAALEINGKAAWKADGLETPSGYIALQAEVPGGGQFLFRNITITEVGYQALFNGKDLTGWEGVGGKADLCWGVKDGLLVCNGKRGPWLRYGAKQFGDCNIRLEYLLEPSGNSGVFVHVPPTGSHHGDGAGVEIQILDDNHPMYKNLKPYQFSGSVYAIVPAEKRVGFPPGKWNSMEINCVGHDFRVLHNGIQVVDAKAKDVPELKKRRAEGFIGLQNHSRVVRFRNIRIGPPLPE